MKIWAKLYKNDRIVKEILYTSPYPMKYAIYQLWVREISHELEIPTPIVIPPHYKNFALFHNTRFRSDDFVEHFDYDIFMLEDCKDS